MALVAGLFVYVLLRRTSSLTHPALFGEDGLIYLPAAGDPSSLFEPYRSQLWLLPRLVSAGVAAAVPITAWPPAMYIAGAAVATGVAATVLLPRARPLLGPLPLRILLALVLLGGLMTTTLQGNVVNAHWLLPGSTFVLLALSAPAGRWGRAGELAWLAVACLSGMTAVFTAPVALWSMWHGRRDATRAYLWARGVLVLGAAAFVLVFAQAHSDARGLRPGLSELAELPHAWFVRAAGGLALGDTGLARVGDTASLLVATAVTAALAVLVWLDRRGPSIWWLIGGALSAALVLAATPRGKGWFLTVPFSGERYMAASLIACALVAFHAVAVSRTRTQQWAGAPLVVASVVATVIGYRLPALPPVPPAELATYEACVGAGRTDCSVEIAPLGQGFYLRAPGAPPLGS